MNVTQSVFAGMSIMVFTLLFVLWVLLVVAHWRMFTKAGEKGWKALVPVYSDYTLFKLVWNTKSFWVFVGLSLATSLIMVVGGQYTVVNGQLVATGGGNAFLNILSFIASVGVLLYSVLLMVKTALAYGKSPVFALGLFFLPNIFTLILAFGSAEYVGPQE